MWRYRLEGDFVIINIKFINPKFQAACGYFCFGYTGRQWIVYYLLFSILVRRSSHFPTYSIFGGNSSPGKNSKFGWNMQVLKLINMNFDISRSDKIFKKEHCKDNNKIKYLYHESVENIWVITGEVYHRKLQNS